jgi:protoheme IX farnesyltransferase
VRTTLSGLIRACHPEPTAVVTVAVAGVAVAAGGAPGVVALVGLTVLATQLATGWANDALDAERDRVTGRADKPIPAGSVARRTVAVAAVLAAAVTVPLALLSGPRAAAAALLGLAMGLLYDWPLKFTALSVLPYLVAFGAIVAFAVLALPGSPTPPWWLVAAGALLGGGAHFVNALPDLADDERTGVRGLPHRIGPTASAVVSAVLLLGATLVLVLGPAGPPSATALAVVAGTGVLVAMAALAPRRPGSRHLFRGFLLVALADVVLLLVSSSGLR